VEWLIELDIHSKKYKWSGRFIKSKEMNKASKYLVNSTSIILPRIADEKLVVDGEVIIERDKSNLMLKGTATPKISLTSSSISIYSEESEIKPIL